MPTFFRQSNLSGGGHARHAGDGATEAVETVGKLAVVGLERRARLLEGSGKHLDGCGHAVSLLVPVAVRAIYMSHPPAPAAACTTGHATGFRLDCALGDLRIAEGRRRCARRACR